MYERTFRIDCDLSFISENGKEKRSRRDLQAVFVEDVCAVARHFKKPRGRRGRCADGVCENGGQFG